MADSMEGKATAGSHKIGSVRVPIKRLFAF